MRNWITHFCPWEHTRETRCGNLKGTRVKGCNTNGDREQANGRLSVYLSL